MIPWMNIGGGALALKLGKGTKKLVVAGVKEGVALTETSYEAIKLNRTIKRVAKASDSVKLDHLIELKNSKVKFTPEDVIFTHKMPNGKIAFLEKGSSSGRGFAHILKEHEMHFMSKGITKDEIPTLIKKALEKNKVVDYQGKGKGRPIYELIYKEKKQRVAITIGSNGFVVGANPKSIK